MHVIVVVSRTLRLLRRVLPLATPLFLLGCGGGANSGSDTNAPRVTADAGGLTRCFADAYNNADKDAAFARCEEQNYGSEWRRNAKAREGAPLGSGYLDPEIVRAGVNARMPRMKACYAAGLRRDASLRGDMKFRFVIDTSGHAINVEDAGSHMKDKQVLTCVMTEFSALRFPQPEGGIVNITYPLVISPGDTSG